jgi:hypothetical protein
MRKEIFSTVAAVALIAGATPALADGDVSRPSISVGSFATGAPPPPTFGPASSTAPLPSFGNFDIVVNGLGSMTAAQQAAFVNAEAFWESQITGYRTQALAGFIPQLTIDASIVAIDGAGGILGQAGATSVSSDGTFWTPNAGQMQFDSADVAGLITGGTFGDVILHEMAHVMGFSNGVWDFAFSGIDNSDNTGIVGGADTSFSGARAVAAYNAEFGNTDAFVPVEQDFGAGTAFSHWDEVLFNSHGAEFTNPALMTGFLTSPNYVSRTTIGAFEDIGYAGAAVPLPATAPLLALGAGALLLLRRRVGK